MTTRLRVFEGPQRYRDVSEPKAIAIHDYPTLDSCVVSHRIKPSLKRIQDAVERSLQKSLAGITLASFC